MSTPFVIKPNQTIYAATNEERAKKNCRSIFLFMTC